MSQQQPDSFTSLPPELKERYYDFFVDNDVQFVQVMTLPLVSLALV